MTSPGVLEERLLVLAPHGRDAEVIAGALAREGFGCSALDSIDALLAGMDAGAAGAIVADEALEGAALERLIAHAWHARKPGPIFRWCCWYRVRSAVSAAADWPARPTSAT
jgi:hypothetical protein